MQQQHNNKTNKQNENIFLYCLALLLVLQENVLLYFGFVCFFYKCVCVCVCVCSNEFKDYVPFRSAAAAAATTTTNNNNNSINYEENFI